MSRTNSWTIFVSHKKFVMLDGTLVAFSSHAEHLENVAWTQVSLTEATVIIVETLTNLCTQPMTLRPYPRKQQYEVDCISVSP